MQLFNGRFPEFLFQFANLSRALSYLIALVATSIAFQPILATGQIKHWNAGDGVLWTAPASWTPVGVPILTDSVQIGSLPQAYGEDVYLNSDRLITALTISNGARLITLNHHSLQIFLDTNVFGTNPMGNDISGLVFHGDPASSGITTRDLTVSDQGYASLNDDAKLNIGRTLNIGSNSTVLGDGVIQLNGNTPFALVNDGIIRAQQAVGETAGLTVNQNGNGAVDLDGSVGNGVVSVTRKTQLSNLQSLTFNTGPLPDPFSGTINVSPGAQLNMNIAGGWTADANSQINVIDYAQGFNTGVIQGSPLSLAGTVIASRTNLGGMPSPINGRFESVVNIQTAANVIIEEDNALEFAGTTTINGGNFVLDQDGFLTFTGATTLAGGTFITPSNQFGDGIIDFNGPTTWNGNVTINGYATQNGQVIVSGPTTINAGVFNMDGNAATPWDINASLVVNAENIEILNLNVFDGIFDIGVGAFPQLSINLDQPDAFWTMAGQMMLANNFPFQQTRVSGSPMRVEGDLDVNGANIRITADTDFAEGSSTAFQTANSSLVMRGNTTVEAGALFMNEGILVNGANGQMNLNGGASLNELGLRNQGTLEIGDSAGIADVASFESTADARWVVEIGGPVAGDEHDVLLVGNGDAVLDGLLKVKLIDAGNGLFVPQVGDEFTILSTVGSVVGQFDNAPISILNGTGYQWEVLYHSNDVTLRLASTIANVFLGDVNQDGIVSLLDVAPFVDAVTTGTYVIQADINCDGSVDLLDVSPFIELLTG